MPTFTIADVLLGAGAFVFTGLAAYLGMYALDALLSWLHQRLDARADAQRKRSVRK